MEKQPVLVDDTDLIVLILSSNGALNFLTELQPIIQQAADRKGGVGKHFSVADLNQGEKDKIADSAIRFIEACVKAETHRVYEVVDHIDQMNGPGPDNSTLH